MRKDKKKGTPVTGAPVNQDNDSTKKAKTQAETMFDKIKYGKANAIRCNDRTFRRLVAEANNSGDCIINNGGGYYRPEKGDEEELKHYLYAELHRADEIQNKVDSMREAFYGRY